MACNRERAEYRRESRRQECVRTSMMVVAEYGSEHIERRRQIFRTMQGTKTRKHGARGGHDKATLPTVISTRRFDNSRLTCVYKHK